MTSESRYYVPDATDPEVFKQLEDQSAVCRDCGCVMVDRAAHDEWHAHRHVGRTDQAWIDAARALRQAITEHPVVLQDPGAHIQNALNGLWRLLDGVDG